MRSSHQKLTKQIILKKIKEHKEEIRQYSVIKIGLFGSYLKGTQSKGSDIDLIVDFSIPTFDNYINLKLFLQKIFRKKVDLVIEESLKPALEYVKEDAIYVKRL